MGIPLSFTVQIRVTVPPGVTDVGLAVNVTVGAVGGLTEPSKLQAWALLPALPGSTKTVSDGVSGTIKRLQMVLAERMASSGIEALPALMSLKSPTATR